MKVVRDAAALRAELGGRRSTGANIGFVPTMGALHEGHLSLVRAARAATEVVVLSIFVNPLQFAPGEDFDAYPREEHADLERARTEGVDVVFLPAVDDMYPPGATTRVTVGRLGETLEGEDRPGHFDGVATVVAKLFHLVQPHVAFFGQKDAQQVAVINRMVADLDFGVSIVVCETVRASDGLALSSRNSYLSQSERARATAIYGALRAGRDALASDGDPTVAERVMWESLSAVEGVLPSYARAVDPVTFDVPEPGGPVLLAIAAKVGDTRLIDNLLVENPSVTETRSRAVDRA